MRNACFHCENRVVSLLSGVSKVVLSAFLQAFTIRSRLSPPSSGRVVWLFSSKSRKLLTHPFSKFSRPHHWSPFGTFFRPCDGSVLF